MWCLASCVVFHNIDSDALTCRFDAVCRAPDASRMVGFGRRQSREHRASSQLLHRRRRDGEKIHAPWVDGTANQSTRPAALRPVLAPLLGGFREDYKVDEGGDGRASERRVLQVGKLHRKGELQVVLGDVVLSKSDRLGRH